MTTMDISRVLIEESRIIAYESIEIFYERTVPI